MLASYARAGLVIYSGNDRRIPLIINLNYVSELSFA